MSNVDHLPDDATRLTPSHMRSQLTDMSDHYTVLGWVVRYALILLLLGAGIVFGGLLGPALYRLLN